ncbi:MAG: alpha/beta hydrolase [Nitrospirota bacterium]
MSERFRRMFFAIFLGLLLGYLALIVFVYIKQDGMVYYPDRNLDCSPEDIGLEFEEIIIRTRDGVSISAWYIPAGSERGTVLFCHGNAGNISHRLDSIRIFHDLNLSVLIFDYRGYGKSGGSPTEMGTYLDAEAAWEFLVNVKCVRPENVILFGRSLGGAVAAETALRRRAGAIIIESGFTSIPDLGKRFYPYFPVRLLSHYHYSTIDRIDKIRIPKLLIHSPDDEIIPFEHGSALFEKAEEPKEFLRIRGGHNDGFLISGKTYVEGLDLFINKHFPG